MRSPSCCARRATLAHTPPARGSSPSPLTLVGGPLLPGSPQPLSDVAITLEEVQRLAERFEESLLMKEELSRGPTRVETPA